MHEQLMPHRSMELVEKSMLECQSNYHSSSVNNNSYVEVIQVNNNMINM